MFAAARLDGANLLQIWARIAMPLAWPTTVAVSVLTFAIYWSDFVSPLIYLKSEENYTLPVGLHASEADGRDQLAAAHGGRRHDDGAGPRHVPAHPALFLAAGTRLTECFAGWTIRRGKWH